MKFRSLALATALMVAPVFAWAHAPKAGHNGGPQADAGSFHVEVVPRGTTLLVYLRDHADKEVKTDGYKGTAIFVINGKPERISLVPDGDNRLKGTSTVPLPPEPKGAVQITTGAGSTVQGKFN